jgi:hypothetical protein
MSQSQQLNSKVTRDELRFLVKALDDNGIVDEVISMARSHFRNRRSVQEYRTLIADILRQRSGVVPLFALA